MLQRKCVFLCVVFVLCTVLIPLAGTAESVNVSAASAVLYEPQSGRVLFEKNAHEVRPMASTTKLMTALIGAEYFSPEQMVVVSQEAVRTEGSSLGLLAGDVLSANDLITGMLLASGNDAANAVALAVAPTTEAFAERMNSRAEEIGMSRSCFVTPSGLDADGHASTAYDLALLGAAVLQNPLLKQICAQKTAQVKVANPARTIYVKNHNRLLSLYADCVGLKTGFTKKSGRGLVSAAERNGVTLIAVTLQAPNDWNDHISLFEYGFGVVERVAFPKVLLPRLLVSGGKTESVSLAIKCPEDVVVPKGETLSIRAVVELPRFVLAPLPKGAKVGNVRYLNKEKGLAVVPIVTAEAIEKQEPLCFFKRFQNRVRQLLLSVCGS